MSYELSGTFLTNARHNSGLTRQAAAVAIDVSIAALQTAERGLTELRPSKLRHLAAIYDVPMESFFVHVEDVTDAATSTPEVPEDAKSAPPLTPVPGRS